MFNCHLYLFIYYWVKIGIDEMHLFDQKATITSQTFWNIGFSVKHNKITKVIPWWFCNSELNQYEPIKQWRCNKYVMARFCSEQNKSIKWVDPSIIYKLRGGTLNLG